MTTKVQNPILPGFHADPSICRVGEAYYIATSTVEWFPGVCLHHSRDLVNWEVVSMPLSKPVNIFRGTNLMCTEGPHIYNRNGWYYLMCAEAGTGYEHAETLARSRSIEGPYEVHPKNPVLTSWEGPRNGLPSGQCPRGKLYEMGPSYIKKAGHASICDTPEGRWLMVHLCGRPLPGTDCCVLGRETSIQEVEWREDDWLYLKHGGNHPMEYLELPGEIPVREELKKSGVRVEYGFESQEEFNGKFLMDFQTLRMPRDPMDINVTARPG